MNLLFETLGVKGVVLGAYAVSVIGSLLLLFLIDKLLFKEKSK